MTQHNPSPAFGNAARRQTSLIQFAGGMTIFTVLLLGGASLWRFDAAQSAWLEHSTRATAIGNALADLNRHIGYGGFIHNFKNLVLRRDLARYQESIEANIASFRKALDQLDALLVVPDERAALAEVRRVLNEYASKYQSVPPIVAAGASSDAIDAMVTVDDGPALRALIRLNERATERERETRKIAEADYVNAVRFAWIGGVLVAFSLLMATALLTRFLNRLLAANEAMLKAQQHLDNLLDTAPDPMLTVARNGRILRANQMAEKFFGYSSAELLNMKIEQLIPECYRQAHQEPCLGYFADPTNRSMSTGLDLVALTRNGQKPIVEISLSHSGEGDTRTTSITIRDITDRKRVERMKSEFVSTVSHELRTPLTSIAGALGLVAGGALGELPAQARQMVEIAHKNSQRLTHLINDLLDMEKIAAGKLHFDMQPQPLMTLIEQALEANRAYGAERSVTLARAGAAPGAEVRVDGQRLQQVLANLLSNAIKFSPGGGAVRVSVQPMPGRVRVTVADQGPGIPEAFRARIFQKFAQADASDTRQKNGTGLGLAISRELVERMGGCIGFDSVEGEGAAFWFELPLYDPEKTAREAGDAAPAPSHAPRILVVEDEADVAQVLATLLTRSGYRVDVAHTGQQALAALADTVYDALSLDLMLPDVSGLEIIRRVRQQPQTANLPIIVVSAKMEEGRLALNGDFSRIEWLAKPIDERRLLATVESLLAEAGHAQSRVLHVEDDTDLHQVIRAMVGGRFDFELATSLREARERVVLERFDVVILDIGLPDGSGWDLLPEIRARQPEARVIILSGTDMTADEARRVEAVLLKSQVSPCDLLDALSRRIHDQTRRNRT